jgi:hypothetical protein
MDDSEEPETQVYLNDTYIGYVSEPSSPKSDGSLQDDDAYHAETSEHHSQDVVKETQFDTLKRDTQANHSKDACIAETQFDDLEMDTQAVDEPINFATSQVSPSRVINEAAATPFPLASETLIKRPEPVNIYDVGSGFKFGVAQPRTQNPSKRPLARSTGEIAAARASSMPEPTPEVNRHAHSKF